MGKEVEGGDGGGSIIGGEAKEAEVDAVQKNDRLPIPDFYIPKISILLHSLRNYEESYFSQKLPKIKKK